MNTREELDKLDNEIDDFCEPRKKRMRELRDILEKEFIENQKKFYSDTIAGRLFYSNQQIWSGFTDTIYILKPISCEDWSEYNCCNVLTIKIQFTKGMKKFKSFSIDEDTNRVSIFKTHYKELTPEMLEEFKGLVNQGVIDSFLNFNI